MMDITTIVVGAFEEANRRHAALRGTWTKISMSIGSLLPSSQLMTAVQQHGDIDILLRCFEDEAAKAIAINDQKAHPFSEHYHKIFAELWIGSVYETCRLLRSRELAPQKETFHVLLRDLELLRMPFEKHELANDRKLNAPLKMQSVPPNNDSSDMHEYRPKDNKRAHIMQAGFSQRGSLMWNTFDHLTSSERWLERREISDRMIALWSNSSSTSTTSDRQEQEAAKQRD